MTQTHEYTLALTHKFEAMQPNDNKWWLIDSDRTDREAFLSVLKELIYLGRPFVLDEKNNRFKRFYEPKIKDPTILEQVFDDPRTFLDMNGVRIEDKGTYRRYWRGEVCICTETVKK